MQSSVLCGVRVNMMERRPLVAIGRKATDRIRDNYACQASSWQCHFVKKHIHIPIYLTLNTCSHDITISLIHTFVVTHSR